VTNDWVAAVTTTHQDHVIAHVLGSTVLGYLVFDEALYILLDIGFVWTIFLDGEMGLLPHSVAVNELEIDSNRKDQIKADVDLLLNDQDQALSLFERAKDLGEIKDVTFFEDGALRRFVVTGEIGNLTITMSLTSREIQVMTPKNESQDEAANPGELSAIAEAEHEYLHQRLREDLGREPTEQELLEWLRQHTEGY
jgi:hypothetical protein